MSLLSRLFGGKSEKPKAQKPSEDYKGFRITPDPIREGGLFRVAALIEKTTDGTVQTHHLIRADTTASADEAAATAIAKAKQMIDERGDNLFS